MEELTKFTAKMIYDNDTGMDKLKFEDEPLATLFFSKIFLVLWNSLYSLTQGLGMSMSDG